MMHSQKEDKTLNSTLLSNNDHNFFPQSTNKKALSGLDDKKDISS